MRPNVAFGASEIEMEILRLLRGGATLHGFAMLGLSSKLKRGSVYVFLGRMQSKGWVASEAVKVTGQSGMPRRTYSITPEGIRVYDRAVATASFYDNSR